MKKRIMEKKLAFRALSVVLAIVLALPLLAACDEEDADTCKYCGAQAPVAEEHGLNICAKNALCGTDGHYAVFEPYQDEYGISHYWVQDKDGTMHMRCESCNGWLCDGTGHGGNACTLDLNAQPEDTGSTSDDSRPGSSDATLKSLTVTDAAGNILPLTPAFSPDEYAYEAEGTALQAGTMVTVSGEANHDNAKASAGGQIVLQEGENTITFTVTAEDGVTTRAYTITVNAQPEASDDWTLRAFYVTLPDGTAFNMIDANARKNITVPAATEAEVTAVPSNEKATVAGSVGKIAIANGMNSYTVTVTAENGEQAVFEFRIATAGAAPAA